MTSSPEMFTVPAAHITQDDLAGIAPALAHDNCSFDVLVRELMSGHAQLWRFKAEDAVGLAVTRIENTTSDRELRIWLAAGNGPHRYKDFILETLVKYAKKASCVRLVTQTTPSLAEYYQKNLHFRHMGVVIGLEI